MSQTLQTLGRLRLAQPAILCHLMTPESRLEITPQWPRELVEIASEVSQTRLAAAASAQKAGATTAKAARRLDRMGLSRRDTADVLGISHQRVQQLLVP